MDVGYAYQRVGFIGDEYRHGFFKFGSTTPFPDDSGISGRGQRTRSKVAGHEHIVFVNPGNPGFRFRDEKTIVHKFTVPDIKLSHLNGIAATPGKMKQASLVIWSKASLTLVRPVLTFFVRQCIEIQQGCPIRRIGGIAFKCGNAP